MEGIAPVDNGQAPKSRIELCGRRRRVMASPMHRSHSTLLLTQCRHSPTSTTRLTAAATAPTKFFSGLPCEDNRARQHLELESHGERSMGVEVVVLAPRCKSARGEREDMRFRSWLEPAPFVYLCQQQQQAAAASAGICVSHIRNTRSKRQKRNSLVPPQSCPWFCQRRYHPPVGCKLKKAHQAGEHCCTKKPMGSTAGPLNQQNKISN
ncbi:hypothetical protein L596_005523 [Steinernema carpocapsae]|uniref:Uncharacterized protein n=1 Tax=Steinernema carpocapsae TaxID=34508 RepID=A0A4U8V0V3_STECR|nr:hypothetical protein L596_005523 [Steinernema carpocapsae]